MARMHSRKRGKSGSTRPAESNTSICSYSTEEISKMVLKLRKEGKTLSQIGVTLRDSYGVPSVKSVTGKSIGDLVNDHGAASELPEDLVSLIRKLAMIVQHMEKNKKDMTAKRGHLLTESKIRRLTSYYKRTGKVAADWKLDKTRLQMYF